MCTTAHQTVLNRIELSTPKHFNVDLCQNSFSGRIFAYILPLRVTESLSKIKFVISFQTITFRDFRFPTLMIFFILTRWVYIETSIFKQESQGCNINNQNSFCFSVKTEKNFYIRLTPRKNSSIIIPQIF